MKLYPLIIKRWQTLYKAKINEGCNKVIFSTIDKIPNTYCKKYLTFKQIFQTHSSQNLYQKYLKGRNLSLNNNN